MNSVNWTNYLHSKTLYLDTQKGRPIFYANPDALQMVVDETISTWRFSHLQGRTFYNGTLYKFLQLDSFCVHYKVASFIKFSITWQIILVYQDFLIIARPLNCALFITRTV